MTDQQAELILTRFLDVVGLHEASELIRRGGANIQRSRPGDSGASFRSEGEPEPDHVVEARKRAIEWARARNKNLRPARDIDESNESARAGRDSAIEFLKRRARSTIRK